jgi:prepilin-type N-terminal cleavage/methylation domain-containing protein
VSGVRSTVHQARGFALLELVVVVCAIAILAGFALDRLLPLVGRAQRAAFFQVRSDLTSALLLEAADRITRGEAATLPELAAANPMTLLLEPPANYVGAHRWPDPAAIPRASWYYDVELGRLGYRVGRHTRFVAGTGPADLIELTVEFVYQDRDGDAVFDAAGDRFEGLRLGRCTPTIGRIDA